MENYSNIIASKLYIPKINIPFFAWWNIVIELDQYRRHLEYLLEFFC